MVYKHTYNWGAHPVHLYSFSLDTFHLVIFNYIDTYLINQWEFQDPKMEVLYHIKPYFGGISPYIGLKNGPYIW